MPSGLQCLFSLLPYILHILRARAWDLVFFIFYFYFLESIFVRLGVQNSM